MLMRRVIHEVVKNACWFNLSSKVKEKPAFEAGLIPILRNSNVLAVGARGECKLDPAGFCFLLVEVDKGLLQDVLVFKKSAIWNF